MMVPTWWLVLSGLFFLANIFLFVALGIAALKLVAILKDLTPRIVAIEKQISDLVKKVQDLTAHVGELVDNVGGKAKGVVGSAEGMVQSASRQFERFSPFVVGALTAIRLVGALNQVRKGRGVDKARTRKGIIRRKPKTLLGKAIALVKR